MKPKATQRFCTKSQSVERPLERPLERTSSSLLALVFDDHPLVITNRAGESTNLLEMGTFKWDNYE